MLSGNKLPLKPASNKFAMKSKQALNQASMVGGGSQQQNNTATTASPDLNTTGNGAGGFPLKSTGQPYRMMRSQIKPISQK